MGTSGCIHDGVAVLSDKHERTDPIFFYHLVSRDFGHAARAETLAHADPRAAAFYCRLALERPPSVGFTGTTAR